MPIRMIDPNGDPLDFVDIVDRPEIVQIWENRGWVQGGPDMLLHPLGGRWWDLDGLEDFIHPQKKVEGKQGEDLFRLVLTGIKEVYDVEAVVAGGAVRDLVAGDVEGTKDVDVFIPMNWSDFKNKVEELGWAKVPVRTNKKPYKTTTSKTSTDRAKGVVQGRVIDLVFMDGGLTPEAVDGFPVNAQKCVWNLAEGLVVSPAAKADIEGKKFTISPEITDKDEIKKVRDKVSVWLKRPIYKGWKVIEPKTKEWWQKENEEYRKEMKKTNLLKGIKW